MSRFLSGCLPFFLLLPVLLLVFHSPSAIADDPIYWICPNTGNYTSNSTFHANLNLLLTSLLSRAPPTGYSNNTVGRASNRVHGLALCRGDMTEAQCRECLAGAVDGVVKGCPYKKDATIWYETCHLRYSHANFFGLPTGAEFYMWNVNNVPDPESFGQKLGGLMGNLTIRAAYGPPSSRMFAVGDVDAGGGSLIYGLVQCTRDLSADGCNNCLTEEVGKLPTYCSGKKGCRVIGGSCYLRYELSPFYNASAAARLEPPMLAPLSPTASVSPAPPPSAGGASTPASAATVNEGILCLSQLLSFSFFLLAFAWEF